LETDLHFSGANSARIGAFGAGHASGCGHSGQVSPIESSTSAIGRSSRGGNAIRRIFVRNFEGALAGVWIGAVLHPAVLLALTDGAGFLQHRDCPAMGVRMAGRRSMVQSIEFSQR
jgi:hypothetical protein